MLVVVAKRMRGAIHNIPESASALWRIVSLTAAKTRRIFDVSVACVRLSIHVISQFLLNLFVVWIPSAFSPIQYPQAVCMGQTT